MPRRILYIFINLSILGAVVFGAFNAKDFISGLFSPIGFEKSSTKTKEKTLEAKADIGKEITEAKNEIANEMPVPDGLVEKSFKWQYAGKTYQLSQDLYRTIYDFYKSQPKTYTYFNDLPANWEEEYYAMFTSTSEKYNFAKEIADEIMALGKKNKLSDDDVVELVLTFVQSIPYDDQKASNILSRSGGETMNYPYETLFEGKGVCSDKSFLSIVLLRELGYGTAIFVYNDQNHMAIGIQCPMNYSNYESGYCYGETTSLGNKIGIIPELKAYAGVAVGVEEISQLGSQGSQVQQTTRLGSARIFQKTAGKEYGGIAKTIKINNEISSLKSSITALGKDLAEMKSKLEDMAEDLSAQKEKLERYLESGDIDRYNDNADDYNDDLEDYKDYTKKYNDKVNDYNKKVARYNYLIKA